MELRSKTDQLRYLELDVSDTQKTIAVLEGEAKDLERYNDKNRSESLQQQKAHQKEVSKNLELSTKISSLDNTLR